MAASANVDGSGPALLIKVAAEGDILCVKALLEKGADVDSGYCLNQAF